MDAQQIRTRIEAAQGDVAALRAILADLSQGRGPQIEQLRRKVSSHLFVAQRAQAGVARPAALAEPVSLLLRRSGLAKPDGRPLFRYLMDAGTHRRVHERLRARAPRGFVAAPPDLAASFVLWAAGWFQREYAGGMREWDDLGSALAVPFTGSDGRRLSEEGLRFWRRPTVRGEGVRLWLRTLAVEGGFPARALDDESGWARRYMDRVVADLLGRGTDDPESALACAQAHEALAPRAYRQDVFRAVAADLASAVVGLRREAEADGRRPRNVPASAWLDATRPGWRDDLPIDAGLAGAAALIDGLMRVERLTADGGALGCERLLRKRDGLWRPALRLAMDGVARGELERRLQGVTDRLRAFPGGALARHAAGELAVLEPPGDGIDGWRVRPSRRDLTLPDVPFTTPATLDLARDGRPVAQVTWPGGDPVRSRLAVFDGSADDGTLMLLGAAGGAYSPETVALAVPDGWTVEAGEGGSAERMEGALVDGRSLHRVTGVAYVSTADRDRFRIATGQSGALRDRLNLAGAAPIGLVSDDPEIELFAGAPTATVYEGQRSRAPRPGELAWRPSGDRDWRAWDRSREVLGSVDIAWRDGPFTRDRRRAFALPPGAALRCRREPDGVVFTPEGQDGFGLSSADSALILEAVRGGGFRARFRGKPAHRARLRLSGPNGSTVDVSARVPQRAGLATWSGEVRPPHGGLASRPLSLRQLGEHVAFAEGRQTLRARLLDGANRPLAAGDASWSFEDELPLRGVAADLAAIMLPCANIDLFAELTFDGWSERWLVSLFEAALTLEGGQISRVEHVPEEEGAAVRGRPVAEPWTEVELADVPSTDVRYRRWPDLRSGPGRGWIVYLRRGDDVISRPTVAALGADPPSSAHGLAAALSIPAKAEREAALLLRLDMMAAGEEGAGADLRALAQICASLRGLPPGSLDVLRLLARRPRAAARLALAATADERPAVLGLSDALPFAWCLVPARCWAEAASLARRDLTAQLADLPSAATLASSAVAATLVQVATAEPLLRWPLVAAGMPHPDTIPRPIKGIANDHIGRYGDESRGRGSLFRALGAKHLPPAFLDFDETHLETLDAPCAAAAAAVGLVVLPEDAIRRLKTAARFDPTYFAEAYEAWLMHLMRTSAR